LVYDAVGPSDYIQFGVDTRDTTGAQSSSVTQTFYAWGAQLEQGSFPTSYIPTTSAPATRSADVCSISGADFAGFYNQSEGTWVFEGLRNQLDAHASIIGPITGPTASGVIPIESQKLSWWDDVSFLVNPQIASYAFEGASAYNSAGRALCLDGGAVVTDASPPQNIVTVTIGCRNGVGEYLNGTISRITYYPVRLPDDKLIELTQP
jgi:hypothetical protein